MPEILAKQLIRNSIPVHFKNDHYLEAGRTKNRKFLGLGASHVTPLVEKAFGTTQGIAVRDINNRDYAVFRYPWNFIAMDFDGIYLRVHKETGHVSLDFSKNLKSLTPAIRRQLLKFFKKVEELKKAGIGPVQV
jgi:hypothetical protein